MEFRKIDDTKFQCILDEEDLEENNISLDDFFRNDTDKIHGLLDVVMAEANKEIGIVMDSDVMSLQLAPQPNHSVLLTISSGKEDFGQMLRQAGERAAQAMEKLRPTEESNVIKKNEADNDMLSKVAPFESVAKNEQSGKKDSDKEVAQSETTAKTKLEDNNLIKSRTFVFRLSNMDDFEAFCMQSPKTYGIDNSLYKGGNCYMLILEKGRCAEDKYKGIINMLMEYGEFDSAKNSRIAYIREHMQVVISRNAINVVKRYCD